LGDDRYFALHVPGSYSSPYLLCSYRDVRAPLVWLNLAESQVPVMDGFPAMGNVLDLRKLHCVCAACGLNRGNPFSSEHLARLPSVGAGKRPLRSGRRMAKRDGLI